MKTDKNLPLSVNTSSSSPKISVFALNNSESYGTAGYELVIPLLTATVKNLILLSSRLSFSAVSSNISIKKLINDEINEITDHESAFAYLVRFLEQNICFVKDHVKHICHRVVHDGDYPGPVLISSESYHHIESLTDLALL